MEQSKKTGDEQQKQTHPARLLSVKKKSLSSTIYRSSAHKHTQSTHKLDTNMEQESFFKICGWKWARWVPHKDRRPLWRKPAGRTSSDHGFSSIPISLEFRVVS